MTPSLSTFTNHLASSSLINCFHGGMAVPGRPSRMVWTKNPSGLSCRFSGKRGVPKPPFMVMPWQEPQSWRSRYISSFCRLSAMTEASFFSPLLPAFAWVMQATVKAAIESVFRAERFTHFPLYSWVWPGRLKVKHEEIKWRFWICRVNLSPVGLCNCNWPLER